MFVFSTRLQSPGLASQPADGYGTGLSEHPPLLSPSTFLYICKKQSSKRATGGSGRQGLQEAATGQSHHAESLLLRVSADAMADSRHFNTSPLARGGHCTTVTLLSGGRRLLQEPGEK